MIAGEALVDDLFRIATHEDDFQAGVVGLELIGKLAATHLGHDDVGEQQIDVLAVPAHDLERLGTVVRNDHLIAMVSEDGDQQATNTLLVLGHENRSAAVRFRQGIGDAGSDCRRLQPTVCHQRRFALIGSFHPREKHLDGGAEAQFALDHGRAVALAHKPVHRRQTQAAPFAHVLGRVKGLEHVPAGLIVHADPRVLHLQLDVQARLQTGDRLSDVSGQFRVPRRDRQRAAVPASRRAR